MRQPADVVLCDARIGLGVHAMRNARHRYVVDEEGKQTAVIVGIEEYRELLDALEELDSIRAYDAAKTSGEKPVPFEEAVGKIERTRR